MGWMVSLRQLFAGLSAPSTNPAGSAKQPQEPARAIRIRQAYDHALSQVVVIQLRLDNHRLPSLREARSIIIANDLQCGPLARAAHDWLLTQGVDDVDFKNLQGQFALVDRRSGLIFDVETPHGCHSRSELAVGKREHEYHLPGADHNDVIDRYAKAWLDQRRSIIASEAGA